MGNRTSTAHTPPRTSSLRDYRTLTLPAVTPAEDSWQPMTERRDDLHHGQTIAAPVIARPAHVTRTTSRVRRTIAPLRLDIDDLRAGASVPADVRTPQRLRRASSPLAVQARAPRREERAPRAEHGRRLAAAARHVEPLRARASATVSVGGKAIPVWLLANLALFVAVALGVAVPKLARVDAAAACNWHTVQPGDTLGNLGWQYHSSALALAAANHIANPDLIYVGQQLCIPMSSTAQAPSAPAVPAVQGKTATFTGQTANNEQSFVQLALPYAVSAHQQCNWPVSLILAQWGLEHGWQIPGFTGYNWGNSSAITGLPSVPGTNAPGSPSAFAYAKTPADGVVIYVTFCKMGFYTHVAPAAASGGVDAAAVALGQSPWDAGHYTNIGSPGSSLLNELRVYNLYWYDDPAHQGQQTASTPQTTTTQATTSTAAQTKPATTTTLSATASLAPEPCSTDVPSSVWTSVSYKVPWTVPPDCYAGVFTVNPANYVKRPGYGWCNWWVEVLRPDEPTLTWGSGLQRGSTPRVGATVYFAPFNQGASPAGHFAHVEAISPDGGWVLVSEMNDTWRGAGFAKVNYRFVKVEPGVSFIY
jgi:LysM repeat protein